MERKRLQHRRMKQQQQQRIFNSQQDLTEDLHLQHHHHHQSLTDISSSIETLNDRSVSQLINEFETRTNHTSFSSCTRKPLSIMNNVISNKVDSNSRHMSIRTMNIKGNRNNNDSINNTVCSSISPVINDDNSRVIVGIHRHQHIDDDKEQEKKEQVTHQILNNDRHKQDLPLLSICSIENKNNNHQYLTPMLTRSTDIDEAELTLGKRHEIRFHDLIIKEAQLNDALADLLSMTNDADKSSSINSSPSRSITNNIKNNKTNTISDSIDILNNLLETLDVDHKTSNTNTTTNNNQQKKETNDNNHPVKPINMFW